MLYVFYGTDRATASAKAHDLIATLRARAPEAEYIQLTEEEVPTADFDELLNSQGLFKRTYIVLLYGAFQEDALPLLKESEHVFVCIYGKADARTKKLFEKHASKAQAYDVKESKPTFNVFAVADALRVRDRVGVWEHVNHARLLGISGEETVGIVFWALKDMLLKNKMSKWKREEVQEMLQRVALLPHEARRNSQDVYNALELFALGV